MILGSLVCQASLIPIPHTRASTIAGFDSLGKKLLPCLLASRKTYRATAAYANQSNFLFPPKATALMWIEGYIILCDKDEFGALSCQFRNYLRTIVEWKQVARQGRPQTLYWGHNLCAKAWAVDADGSLMGQLKKIHATH